MKRKLNSNRQVKQQSNKLGELAARFQTLTAVAARANLSAKLGMQYGTDRKLYQALGYKSEITYTDCLTQYTRQDIARALIERPVKVTWSGNLSLTETNTSEKTALEKQWVALSEEHSLPTVFARLDKLTGLGRYGCLLLGYGDVSKLEKFKSAVSSSSKNTLIYVKPLSEDACHIHSYVTDVNNPRYGLVELYSVSIGQLDGGKSAAILVHNSRIIHVVDSQLEYDTHGSPRLEPVFNRLQDLEKIIGGSAEMYWRGARPGYAAKVDTDYEMSTEDEDAMQAQIDEFEHNLRRMLTARGVSYEALAQQIADPTTAVDVQIQMIAAESGIPKRILTGSERGELSSSQDSSEWAGHIQARRHDFAEPKVVRPFVNRMIEHGILPKAKDRYGVKWSDLFSISEKDQAEIGRIRATSLNQYMAAPLAPSVVPPEAFFKFFCGFSEEQIELIMEMEMDEMFLEAREMLEPTEQPRNAPGRETSPPQQRKIPPPGNNRKRKIRRKVMV